MPWATKTLYPAEKWLPLYAPNDPWEVVPLASDPNFPWAKPPPGVPVYWWKHPKKDWPYQTPGEPKIFGCFPAMQTWMADDHTHHFPPLGIIKTHMAGQKVTEATERIAFQNIKMHMRHLSPDEMKLKMTVAPFGMRYRARGMAWDKYTGSSEYIEVKSRDNKWNYPANEPFTKGGSATSEEPTKDLFT
jgi:hypothetical protein